MLFNPFFDGTGKYVTTELVVARITENEIYNSDRCYIKIYFCDIDIYFG